jgi:hypothetical protein
VHKEARLGLLSPATARRLLPRRGGGGSSPEAVEVLPSPTRRPVAHSPARLLLTVKIRQPRHEFTFGVRISFIPYLLVLTPVV